jgi:hypothetical protein
LLFFFVTLTDTHVNALSLDCASPSALGENLCNNDFECCNEQYCPGGCR